MPNWYVWLSVPIVPQGGLVAHVDARVAFAPESETQPRTWPNLADADDATRRRIVEAFIELGEAAAPVRVGQDVMDNRVVGELALLVGVGVLVDHDAAAFEQGQEVDHDARGYRSHWAWQNRSSRPARVGSASSLPTR